MFEKLYGHDVSDWRRVAVRGRRITRPLVRTVKDHSQDLKRNGETVVFEIREIMNLGTWEES